VKYPVNFWRKQTESIIIIIIIIIVIIDDSGCKTNTSEGDVRQTTKSANLCGRGLVA